MDHKIYVPLLDFEGSEIVFYVFSKIKTSKHVSPVVCETQVLSCFCVGFIKGLLGVMSIHGGIL